MFVELALLAYVIDLLIGEFPFIPHPVVIMGKFIEFYEKILYRDSIFSGMLLTLSLLVVTFVATHIFSLYFKGNLIVLSLAASTTLASNMLYKSVKEIITHPEKIKYLVSRDTENLPISEIYKAAIETYAENLSDGVVAPLFYLTLFGLEGAFLYKAINTLDSMIGYRTERYEKFGKFAAILDDVANFIPARLTALTICLAALNFKILKKCRSQARKHPSPNAGYPITVMGLALNVKLGGPTSYHGKIKNKPYFGSGRTHITALDLYAALQYKWKIDTIIITTIVTVLVIGAVYYELSTCFKHI